jgi:ribosome assembly protein RRB1
MDIDKQTFIPGRHKLDAGQTLQPDPSTYEMLHTLTTTWPCLSFDIIKDKLGDQRKSYPATVYAVAGTQAEGMRPNENEILVLKMSSLSRMNRPEQEEEDDDSDSDGEEEGDPILESKSIPLNSTTNRIRAHQAPQEKSHLPPTTLTASLAENGHVILHDITPHLTSFDTPGTTVTAQQNKPISTLRMHKGVEGYALDWSPLFPLGRLATGDNDGKIFITTRTESGAWTTDTRPYLGHTSSVEEIQWSPVEKSVFASASSDGTVRIWDVRSKSHTPAVTMQISDVDVNVMSWSHTTPHLLATGDDAGVWSVWDLRSWKPSAPAPGKASKPSPVASFAFHKEQITSIEWHPTEDSVVAVAAGDNTISLWDLAVELDDEESKDTAGVDVPSQLLFVHYMQDVKEAHWHAQIPGAVMGTGGSGFGVFKTISV